jgi:CheY-like chemotaxis protein
MSTVDTLKSRQPVLHSIILADDDPDDHDFFRDILNDIDPAIKLNIVKDGAELLLLLPHFIPDLLFLDLDMPVKNGLECLRTIRSNPQLKTLPVVVFSSTTRPANIETAYEMGADLFLIKSHSYGDLLSSVRALLSLDWSNPSVIKEQYRVNDRYTAFM